MTSAATPVRFGDGAMSSQLHRRTRRREAEEEERTRGPAAVQTPGAAMLRSMQAAGNYAVQQAARAATPQTETRTTRTPIEARIRRAAPSEPVREAAPAGRLDSGRGHEHHPEEELVKIEEAQALPEETPAGPPAGGGAASASAPAGASPEQSAGGGEGAAPTAAPEQGAAPTAAPEQGAAGPASPEQAEGGAPRKISVPDIETPELAELAKCDAIANALGYTGSITRGGAQPTGFGVTRSFSCRLTGITITPFPGVFLVTATLEHPITWQVRSGTGPDGQIDISTAADPDITAANYAEVADDLTPDMSDLNGRPPRDKFWAENLTIRHEKVHADDDHKNGPLATAQAMAWLGTQTASSAADVNALLGRIPSRFASSLLAALSTEDGEKHAYGDGAPYYKARSDIIREWGAAGKYA